MQESILNFIRKNYLYLSIILIVSGIILDLFFNEAQPVKSSKSITDLTGHTVEIQFFSFSYKYEILKILSNLFYGLAVSLLVLVSLELKFDELDKKKFKLLEDAERTKHKEEVETLHQQINENVFNGVLKKLIPEELFSLIVKDILNKEILRKNALWEYEVKESDDKGRYILRQTISYELKNISNKNHTETLVSSISESKLCKSYFTLLKVSKGGKEEISMNQAQLEAKAEIIADSKLTRYDVQLQPQESANVVLNIIHEYTGKIILDTHTSKYSIVNLEIIVRKPVNCRLNIHPSFSSKLEFTDIDSTYRKYKPIPGILLGQGLTYTIEEQ